MDQVITAARNGDCATIRSWVATHGAEHLDAVNSDGQRALEQAAYYRKADAGLLLLEYGADPNIPPLKGQIPPLLGAASQGAPELIQPLIAAGAALDARFQDYATALHYAAWNGYRDIAVMLIRAGADTNAITSRGETLQQMAEQNVGTDNPMGRDGNPKSEMWPVLSSEIEALRQPRLCREGIDQPLHVTRPLRLKGMAP